MPLPIIPIIGLIGSVLDKLIPDKDAAAKAKAEMGLLLATQEFQTQLAQIEVNLADARSGKWWQAGWRPFLGWTCGFAFAYTYIFQPFAMFLAFTFGDAEQVKQISGLPALDVGMMMPILLGMLGLGAYRTHEKVKAVAK